MSSELIQGSGAGIQVVSPDAQDAGGRRLREIAEFVALLPVLPSPDPTDRYNSRTLTTVWLNNLSASSIPGDGMILLHWLRWCERDQIDPLAARKVDTDAWKSQMTAVKRGPGSVETWQPAARIGASSQRHAWWIVGAWLYPYRPTDLAARLARDTDVEPPVGDEAR